MARQVIKAPSDRFKTIQEGLQTCLIHRNDRRGRHTMKSGLPSAIRKLVLLRAVKELLVL